MCGSGRACDCLPAWPEGLGEEEEEAVKYRCRPGGATKARGLRWKEEGE